MKALLFLLAVTASLFATPRDQLDGTIDKLVATLPSGKPALAVMPLEGDPKMGRALAEYLVSAIQSSGRVTIIERGQFGKVVEELGLSMTGLLDEDKALEAGKALSAKFLLLGSIGDVMGEKKVNLRLVETETGKVLEAASFTAKEDVLIDFSKELLGEKGQVSASVFRSAIIPGWGQFYANHPVRGTLSLVSVLGSAAWMTMSFVQSAGYETDRADFRAKSLTNSGDAKLQAEFTTANGGVFNQTDFNDWKLEQEADLVDKRDDAKSLAMIGVGLTAGIYLLNLLDATLVGMESKKNFDLYFSSNGWDAVGVNVALAF